VARNPAIICDAQLAQLEALNTDIIAYFEKLVWSPRYIFWRLFNAVSRPSRRQEFSKVLSITGH
jgi:hypothetical protein